MLTAKGEPFLVALVPKWQVFACWDTAQKRDGGGGLGGPTAPWLVPLCTVFGTTVPPYATTRFVASTA